MTLYVVKRAREWGKHGHSLDGWPRWWDGGPTSIQWCKMRCPFKKAPHPLLYGLPTPLSLFSTPSLQLYYLILAARASSTHVSVFWPYLSHCFYVLSVDRLYGKLLSSPTRQYATLILSTHDQCLHPWLHIVKSYYYFTILLMYAIPSYKLECFSKIYGNPSDDMSSTSVNKHNK